MTTRFDVSAVPLQGGYIAKRCPVVIQNRMLVPALEVGEPSADARMRMDEGIVFEANVASHLQSLEFPQWVFLEDLDRAEHQRQTMEAMAGAARLIFNPYLPADEEARRTGRPDLLIWDRDGYVPVDVKHRKTLDPDEGSALVSELEAPTSAYHLEGHVMRKNLDDALQLAHYRRMLEALGHAASSLKAGIIGKEAVIVWYDLEEPMWITRSTSNPSRKTKKRSSLEKYDFEFGWRMDIAAAALEVAAGGDGELLVEPMHSGECWECGFRNHCFETLLAGSGDASLVPGSRFEHWKAFRDQGIRTREQLAALHYPTARLVSQGVEVSSFLAGVSDYPADSAVSVVRPRAKKQIESLEASGIFTVSDLGSLDSFTAQFGSSTAAQILDARAGIGEEAVYRCPGQDGRDVPRADIEIDLDMENVLDGVYLWGTLLTDCSSDGEFEGGYRPFVTWDDMSEAAELAVFEELWNWLGEQRFRAEQLGLSLAVYVWHEPAENTVARRIAANSGLAEELESLIASDQWVDLKKVFTRSWMTGGSASLKAIAPLAGYEWPVDDPGGGLSMVKYLEAIGESSEDARNWILEYNRGDVEATKVIRDWVDTHGSTWPEVPTD